IAMLPDGAWFAASTPMTLNKVPGPHCMSRGQKLKGDMNCGCVRVRYIERWGKSVKEEADVSTHFDVDRASPPQQVAEVATVNIGAPAFELTPQEISVDPFAEI
ncbi:MAG: hypothetical protein KGL39_20475, partial [Patescibacteria group bacterium]|nr:hypothetical protein [Patescibacteria group bacterium]